MFKTTHNMMKLKVKIKPQTPLLVASGKTFDVTRPDIQFIRINTPQGETVYIPGSSIKGVLRAGMESILGETEKWRSTICCTSEKLCHDKHKSKKENNKLPYRYHCPVCRTFGSGDLASHLEISDVFPFDLDDKDPIKEQKIKSMEKFVTSRNGIKIDRKTGKTFPGALFEYEILGGGELFGEFTFTNYELYQPGMLFTLFDLSNEGFLRYGHSKSRGLGVIHFEIESIQILQMGTLKGEILKGIGVLPSSSEPNAATHFYLKQNDKIDTAFTSENKLFYSQFSFSKSQIESIIPLFKEKVDLFISHSATSH